MGPCVGSKKRITAEIRECALYASGGGSTTGSSGSTARSGGSTAVPGACMPPPPGLAVPLAVPPALPPGRPSVSLQRQYRRLRRQYRCWACRSSPGAGSAASTAAREALCVPTAAVPPSPAAVPELRDGFPRQKEPLEKNRRVQRHYRQDRR